jgi:hypothetical protein
VLGSFFRGAHGGRCQWGWRPHPESNQELLLRRHQFIIYRRLVNTGIRRHYKLKIEK